MTKDKKEMTPEELLEAIKREACSVSDGIIEAEKKLHYLERISPKNLKERALLLGMQCSLKMMKKAAKITILKLMSLAKTSDIKMKKEDLEKMQEYLASCTERKTKKVSPSKAKNPVVKKQLIHE